ncbi:MAG: hypothetical protein P8M12_00870 [Flavobacteriales bacterium]|nr:hypothetical protein [Flavobacteriales bacterium]
MDRVGPVSILNEQILQLNSGIVLINAHKKPPHLGLFSLNKYFSLTATEVQNNLDLSIILQVIHRKKIPSLFIIFNKKLNNSLVEKTFSSYTNLKDGTTCINPINKLIDQQLCNVNNVQFIYELIPLLAKANELKSYHHLYCDTYLSDELFELRKYSMEDVLNRIKSLVK